MTDPWQTSGQQPQPQAYLERNPYGELSEQNLNQQAGNQQQQQPPYPQQQPSGYPQPEGYPQQFPQQGYPSGGQGPYASQPGQPGAGDPYGQPGPYGYPAPGYYPPPKQSNGLALAGAITSFVPIVGLVLSIIGRAKAKALGGAGKTAGTVGIVLSLLFTGGFGFLVYKVANSTAADPGCISAESTARSMDSELNADSVAVNNAIQAGDQTQVTAARQKMLNDMANTKAGLDSALAKASHANVRSAIQALDNDLAQFITAGHQFLSGAQNGDTVEKLVSQMTTDGNAVDSLCGNVTNG